MKLCAVLQHAARQRREHSPSSSTIDRERQRNVERAGRSLFGCSLAATTARRYGERTS
jgi:hypothetical protein